jgi:uncharacterized protein YjiS (DUF1127 family)
MSRILRIEHYPTFPPGRFGPMATLSLVTHWWRRLNTTANMWTVRSETRRALAALEPHQLADIGKTFAEARRESSKAFWSA